MPKITINKIIRKQKTSKEGKPWTSVNILTKDKNGNDQWLSAFGGGWNQNWSDGDVVDVEIEKKGEYLNIKSPPRPTLENVMEALAEIKALLKVKETFKPDIEAYAERYTEEDEGDMPF